MGAAVGCVGMSVDDFCACDFDEFSGIFRAWQRMRESDERERWEQTRILAWFCVQPHVKKRITPKQLLPLPWDKREGGVCTKKANLTPEQRRQRFERLANKSG